MQLTTFLQFNGQCEAAFKYYEANLGGRIQTMLSYAGTPAASGMPAEWRSKIIHGSISIGDQVLRGSDAPADRYQEPKGFSISLETSSAVEAEQMFSLLAAGGTVRMPIESTFFATRYGTLIDRFGIPWIVVCEKKGE
jgi:PhnB protein